MGQLLILFTVCVFCVNLPSSHLLKFFGNENAFVGLNTMQLIQKRGYPVELHYTTTEDGYIIALHRIPHGRNKKSNPAAPPILLVHGLLNSAADWVCLDYSLGFLLADMGYDVWLANARGTTWSKQHTTLNVVRDEKEFWNFSWHEIGYYDLPANIDYVLKITNNTRLNYLGFSQGATSFCVLMSAKPEYNEKITVAIFLAPAVIQYNVKSIPFRIISRNTELIRHLGNTFRIYNTEALGIAKESAKLLCGMKSPLRAICLELLFFFTGSEDPAQYINVDVQTVLSNTPESVSLLQLIHYGQIMSKGEFRHLDLGLEENFKKYNSIRPPFYNLSRVTSPVALYYGKNDGLVPFQGVRQLRKMLPNVIYDHLVKYDPFGHVDFSYAKDVTALFMFWVRQKGVFHDPPLHFRERNLIFPVFYDVHIVALVFTNIFTICGFLARMVAKIFSSFYSLYSIAKDFLSNILWQTLSLQSYSKSVNGKQSNEDFIGLKPVEMILKRGYPIEIHYVITEDGYILSLYRIRYGKTDSDKSKPRIPVLLMHGLMASGADWVSSDNGLGYLLGEKCFDVWISNARGTIPSRSHIDRDIFKNEKKYWDFSWQEIGYYDLPASIDYILSTTNHNKLFYIGHSQGATCFLAMTSTRPEYNNKIILSVLLAPTVFCINRHRELVMYFKRNMPLLKPITDFIRIYNVRGVNLIRFAGRLLGKNNSLFRPICVYVASLLIGYSDESQFDEVNIEVVVNTTPSTCSLNQLYHFGQIMTSGIFCQFDYGEEENMRRYKSLSPPLYDLSDVTSPVAIYYGKNDVHVSIADIDLLCSKLPNVVSKHLIEYELFNHVDFLYAKDVGSLLYNKIVDLMNNYGGNPK